MCRRPFVAATAAAVLTALYGLLVALSVTGSISVGTGGARGVRLLLDAPDPRTLPGSPDERTRDLGRG